MLEFYSVKSGRLIPLEGGRDTVRIRVSESPKPLAIDVPDEGADYA